MNLPQRPTNATTNADATSDLKCVVDPVEQLHGHVALLDHALEADHRLRPPGGALTLLAGGRGRGIGDSRNDPARGVGGQSAVKGCKGRSMVKGQKGNQILHSGINNAWNDEHPPEARSQHPISVDGVWTARSTDLGTCMSGMESQPLFLGRRGS